MLTHGSNSVCYKVIRNFSLQASQALTKSLKPHCHFPVQVSIAESPIRSKKKKKFLANKDETPYPKQLFTRFAHDALKK